ncbi:MAG: hypothetical protein JWO38_2097 [Gemmataceae bacterium]|nr:hypothetical protein [Gemmataceae bacterium]
MRELIDRAMKLSPADRESIALELLNSVEPGRPDSDREPWESVIARRSAEVAAGSVTPLTRDQAEAQVREAIRKLGVEP